MEIGYGIVPSRQRRGYATEAVHAMVAGILQVDGIETVTAHVELDNPASSRVIQKCGMTLCAQNQQQARTTSARALPDSGLTGQPWGNVTIVRIGRDGAAR